MERRWQRKQHVTTPTPAYSLTFRTACDIRCHLFPLCRSPPCGAEAARRPTGDRCLFIDIRPAAGAPTPGLDSLAHSRRAGPHASGACARPRPRIPEQREGAVLERWGLALEQALQSSRGLKSRSADPFLPSFHSSHSLELVHLHELGDGLPTILTATHRLHLALARRLARFHRFHWPGPLIEASSRYNPSHHTPRKAQAWSL